MQLKPPSTSPAWACRCTKATSSRKPALPGTNGERPADLHIYEGIDAIQANDLVGRKSAARWRRGGGAGEDIEEIRQTEGAGAVNLAACLVLTRQLRQGRLALARGYGRFRRSPTLRPSQRGIGRGQPYLLLAGTVLRLDGRYARALLVSLDCQDEDLAFHQAKTLRRRTGACCTADPGAWPGGGGGRPADGAVQPDATALSRQKIRPGGSCIEQARLKHITGRKE